MVDPLPAHALHQDIQRVHAHRRCFAEYDSLDVNVKPLATESGLGGSVTAC